MPQYHEQYLQPIVRDRPAGRAVCLDIANRYLHSEESAEQTARDLTKRGIFGSLLAGEVLVEEASRQKPHMVSPFIKFARQEYEKVLEQAALLSAVDAHDHANDVARARMRRAQLPILDIIYSKRRFPGQSLVEDMYRKLAKQALGVVEITSANHASKSDPDIELKGIKSELAVLLLAQRCAIRNIGCNEWLPLQSMFSEDHGGDCRKDTDAPAWDMNIFTKAADDEPPAKTYSIQIKTSRFGAPAVGVATVYVNHDLLLHPREHCPGQQIIMDCISEIRDPDRSEHITQRLDFRTEKLLDIIEG